MSQVSQRLLGTSLGTALSTLRVVSTRSSGRAIPS